jgi:hypothetical protein
MKRPRTRSGVHRSPRRVLSATSEQWEVFDALARAEGVSWAKWVRSLQLREAQRSAVTVTGADVRFRLQTDIRKRTRRTG